MPMLSRVIGTIIFASIVFGILGGMHYYVWARLVRDPALPHPYRAIFTVTVILLAVMVPVGYILGRMFGGVWRAVWIWPSVLWMGVLFLLVMLLAGADALRGVVTLASRLLGNAPPDEERRLLLARVVAGGAAMSAATLGFFATRSGVSTPRIQRVPVTLSRLPPELSGMRIAQLTDMHVGPTIGRGFVEEVVQRTNELNPDIIAITGDLVDGSVAELRETVAPIRDLVAKHGVYFVTGNHEYYAGVTDWLRELDRMGVHVMRNERVEIGNGTQSFDFAGVDDYSAARYAVGERSDVDKALEGRARERELVLLAHQPRHIGAAVKGGVGLMLSGHTHGGQIWPFGYLVRLAQPFIAGLDRQGDTQIYVSRGTGYWGPPMRLGSPSEISLLELKSPAAA